MEIGGCEGYRDAEKFKASKKQKALAANPFSVRRSNSYFVLCQVSYLLIVRYNADGKKYIIKNNKIDNNKGKYNIPSIAKFR